MDPERPDVAWTRALLDLPEDGGERFPDEWASVRRRIEMIHSLSLPYETEPAGAPRLAGGRR